MAETTREMVVRLTMDAGGFKKTAAEISRQIRNIDSEMKNMGSDGNKKSLMEEKLGLQKTAVDNLKKAVDDARTKLANANTEKEKLLAAKQLSGLETNLTNAQAKAAALQGQLNALNLIRFGTLATRFGRSMRTMGRSMSLYVTAPLLALGGKAYKSALDFESATASMQKTVRETDTTKYEDIEKALLAMSEIIPTSYPELMELAELAGSLDVSADQVVEFVRAIAMISETADDLDALTGGKALGTLLNITEKGDYKEIENAASAVTELGNNTAATEGEIVDMAQRMAATGTLAGLATEDILALAAGFVSVGINAEAGGTAAGKLLKQMSLAATSNDMNKFAEIMGMDGAQFATAFKGDAAMTMMQFFDSLSQLDAEQQFGALEWLMDNGMAEIRLNNLVAAAANNPLLFMTSLMASRRAYAENIALQEEADKRYNTAESRQNVQLNRMENAAADVGENLVDPILQIQEKIADLLGKFADLDEGTQDWILTAGVGLAVTGPVMVGLGGVIETVGKITKAIGEAKAGTGAWQGLMSSPVLWGIAAGGATLLVLNAIKNIGVQADDVRKSLSSITITLDEDSYNTTMAALAEVRAQTDAISGTKGEYNKNISTAVKAGFGTPDMYGTALGYESAVTQKQITDIASQYAPMVDELNGAIGAETDKIRQAELAAQRDAIQAQWNAEVQAAKDGYMQQVSALVYGMLQSQPDAVAALEKAGREYDLFALLNDVLQTDAATNENDPRWKEIFTQDVLDQYFGGQSFEDIIPNNLAQNLQLKLIDSMTNGLKTIGGEDSLTYWLFQSILTDPLSAGLFDASQASGVLDGIVELFDFKSAGEKLGEDFAFALTPGLADPFIDSLPQVTTAMDTLEGRLVARAAMMGSAVSAAFARNLKLNMPDANGNTGNTNISLYGMTAQDIYKLRQALTRAASETARGYGQ